MPKTAVDTSASRLRSLQADQYITSLKRLTHLLGTKHHPEDLAELKAYFTKNALQFDTAAKMSNHTQHTIKNVKQDARMKLAEMMSRTNDSTELNELVSLSATIFGDSSAKIFRSAVLLNDELFEKKSQLLPVIKANAGRCLGDFLQLTSDSTLYRLTARRHYYALTSNSGLFKVSPPAPEIKVIADADDPIYYPAATT